MFKELPILQNFLKKYPPRKRRGFNDFIVAYLVPTWLWRRWHNWYWHIGGVLSEEIDQVHESSDGVDITQEELRASKPVVEQLLRLVEGNPIVALSLVAFHTNTAISYITREDVEGILGFTVSNDEWPQMLSLLGHYDKHLWVCNYPLGGAFVRACYDKLYEVENWPEYPPLQPLLTVVKNHEWQLTSE